MFPGVWSLSGPRLRAAECSTRGAMSEGSRNQGGRWANDRSATCGSTNATAAAVTLLRNLSMPINGSGAIGSGPNIIRKAALSPRLERRCPICSPRQLPCMRSQAWRSRSRLFERIASILSILSGRTRGFYGHWGDEYTDCEYAFYALLALGHGVCDCRCVDSGVGENDQRIAR